jgi:hypothetical protein
MAEEYKFGFQKKRRDERPGYRVTNRYNAD